MIKMDIDLDNVGRIIAIKEKNRIYEHYGILDGKGGVIHVHKKKECITIDPLDKVLSKAKKVKYLDDDFETRWRNYQHAMTLVGSNHRYRFLTDNCETWVQKIRTGEAYSEQVNEMTRTIATAVLVASAIFKFGDIFGNTDTHDIS